MEPGEILKQALSAVEEAELPDDLRAFGFERAVDMLLGARPAAPTPGGPAGPAQVAPAPASGSGKLASIAAAMAVSAEDIERVFDEHEGTLQFIGDLERLGKTKAAKVQGIATMLLVGRQTGGYDDGSTPDSVLRTELERHGLLDVGNYTKHVAGLKSQFNINGSGRNATYKAKYEGRVKAKELIQTQLAG